MNDSNPRLPIHAATGTELTARSWQTEAPLRMLMNNLDPDNAERPEDLVVYGGTGKAARNWASYDALVRTLRDLRGRRDDARAVRQAGRRHAHPRVGAAGADRQLQPGRRLGQLGGVPAARGPRADDVRPDDGRLVDLHRHPGHPPGHLRDVRRGRRQEVRRDAGRHHHRDRRARRDGRRPAAGGDHERRRRDLHRVRPVPDPAPDRAPLPRRAGRLARPMPCGWRSRRATSGAPLSIGVLGNAADDAARAARVGRADRHRHRPDLGARPAVLPARRHRVRGLGRSERTEDPVGFTKRAQESMAAHVRAMVEFQDAGAEVFDYGNSIRDEARKGGYDRAFEFPGFVPAYIRPLFCEGKGPFRWAALSGDPADIAATDRAILELFPSEEKAEYARLHKWITHGRRAGRVPGPAGADLLAGLRRASPRRSEVQRDGGLRRAQGADRDRPRPPRLRLGRLALPRDRGDARRLRRDRRLGAAQRAGQHRVRRDLGLHPPRRRCRHRAVASTPARSCVADGTELAAQKIERVLTNDPGMGVIRHVDAGYDRAVEVADRARACGSRWPRGTRDTSAGH